ncbi:MAG: L-dopachrome tautomerase-related protein [Pseudomonadota bacterium]
MTRVLFGFAIAFALLLLAARIFWGGGSDYVFVATTPVVDAQQLTTFQRFNQPPRSISIAPSGDVFFTVEPAATGDENKLLRVQDGIALPYPDATTQQSLFDSPSDVFVTSDRVYVLDHGNYGVSSPALHVFDASDDDWIKTIDLKAVAPLGSHLSHIVVTDGADFALIADAGTWRRTAALVVINLKTGKPDRVLAGHAALSAQKWRITPSEGPVQFLAGTFTWRPGLSAIAIDPEGEYLYLSATTNDGLYRVALESVTSLSRQLDFEIERYSDKPLSGGLLVLPQGRILVTDLNNHAVALVKANRTMTTVVQTTQIRWGSDLAMQPSGSLLIADSALPSYLLRGEKATEAGAPYFILELGGLAAKIAAVE